LVIPDFFSIFASEINEAIVMIPRLVDKFTYQNIDYVAVEYTGHAEEQCHRCDLDTGISKLCLRADCKCGECGAFCGNRKRIFIAQNVSAEDRLRCHDNKYVREVRLLEKRIKELNDEVRKVKRESYKKINELNTQVIEKTQKINRLKEVLGGIHDSASIALVKEFNNK